MDFILKKYKYIVALLLIMMLILEITSSVQESQTIDEGVHLSAGYSYLVKRDFRMNTEHPPLMKEISALPLLFYSDKINSAFDKPAWQNYDQWRFAKDLIYFNGHHIADTLFFLGRLPVMLLSILLGFYVFKWSKELFGKKIGLISLLLYTLSPNIIAHSRYVTTDLALTVFFFITLYYFHKYLKSEKYIYFIYTAIFFALAQAVKFSAVILIPILLLLGVVALIIKSKKYPIKKLVVIYLKNLLLLFVITFFIIFACYGFQVQKPIDDKNVQDLYSRQSEILENNDLSDLRSLEKKVIELTDPNTDSGQFILNLANKFPIPAYSYFNGFVKLFLHNYYGHMSYLLGEHSNLGWWYYFIIAFLVKTPTTILIFLTILIAISLGWIFKFFKYGNKEISYHPLWLLVVPPLFHFAFSLTSHINLGLRHILLVYPFIFVLVGYIFIKIKNNRKKFALYVLLIFYAVSSFMIYPHYLAYFNEISGGPGNGTKYLVDSNIDWGQDIKKLKKYMNKNDAQYVCMSYFGQAELQYYDIDFRYLPDNNNFISVNDIDCLVAISATSLYSQRQEYSWLNRFTPDDKIGYSIFIYDFRK